MLNIRYLLSFLFCCITIGLYSADGNLDTTFNAGGPQPGVNKEVPGFGEAVAVQTDNKLVVVAFDADFTGSQVIRYNADGTLEQILVPTEVGFFAFDILIQPDDKILLTGEDNFGNIAIFRYNNDGTPDITFGGGTGQVHGPQGFTNAVVLQADGRIVVGGSFGSGNFLVVRYESDGSSFQVFQIVPGGQVTDLAIQSDGKVIAGGISSSIAYQLVRYDTNGNVDITYGVSGIATGPVGLLFGIVIQSDDKVIAGGRVSNNFQIARFTTTGFLDTTYGMAASGVTVGPSGSGSDVVLQSDERAILIGVFAGNYQLVRYTSDTVFPPAGLIDATFNIPATPAGFASRGAIQGPAVPADNGKIIAVGNDNTNSFVQVARYESSPGLANTIITSPTNGSTFPAGPIIVTGTAENPSNVYILVDGVWDEAAGTSTDFSSNTWSTTVTITTPGSHTIQAVAIYEDGNVDIASAIITITIDGNGVPTNFRGVVSCNAFLHTKECILTMTWTASDSPDVVAYRIFRNGLLIGTVSATSPLRFVICATSSRCANCCNDAAFRNITIVSVNSDGMQSDPVTLELVC